MIFFEKRGSCPKSATHTILLLTNLLTVFQGSGIGKMEDNRLNFNLIKSDLEDREKLRVYNTGLYSISDSSSQNIESIERFDL